MCACECVSLSRCSARVSLYLPWNRLLHRCVRMCMCVRVCVLGCYIVTQRSAVCISHCSIERTSAAIPLLSITVCTAFALFVCALLRPCVCMCLKYCVILMQTLRRTSLQNIAMRSLRFTRVMALFVCSFVFCFGSVFSLWFCAISSNSWHDGDYVTNIGSVIWWRDIDIRRVCGQ